jgi:hypothetical protein
MPQPMLEQRGTSEGIAVKAGWTGSRQELGKKT